MAAVRSCMGVASSVVESKGRGKEAAKEKSDVTTDHMSMYHALRLLLEAEHMIKGTLLVNAACVDLSRPQRHVRVCTGKAMQSSRRRGRVAPARNWHCRSSTRSTMLPSPSRACLRSSHPVRSALCECCVLTRRLRRDHHCAQQVGSGHTPRAASSGVSVRITLLNVACGFDRVKRLGAAWPVQHVHLRPS